MKHKLLLLLLTFSCLSLKAQPVMETGGKQMPDEWIDKDTGHKIMKLTRRPGVNLSFYFHNNPFIGNKMVFYGSEDRDNKSSKQEIYNTRNRQIYTVDLKTLEIEQLTHEKDSPRGEIACAATQEVFYQIADTVYSINVFTKEKKIVYVFPDNFRGSISCVNVDGSLLAGTFTVPMDNEYKKSIKTDGGKSSFNDIFEARTPRIIFTIDTRTKDLDMIHADRAWLNHLQFSPTDTYLLMFCHEGHWHKVDRIWTIDVVKRGVPRQIHYRTMDMEIAGHEWFSPDGKIIWYDLQRPRGETFYVAGVELDTNKKIVYELQRNEWSVHYTTAWDLKTFAGDGGSPGNVAKAPDGQWIYLFKPDGNKFVSEKLVSMRHHSYKLEPNVHYSPDGKWIIFRANFEGEGNVYAVEIAKK
ncbi:MAG: oligogalacturonate lyase family protein [Dysgonomonas sp.]